MTRLLAPSAARGAVPLGDLSLSRLSRSDVAIANLRARRRAPLSLPTGVGPLTLVTVGSGTLDRDGVFAHIVGTVGGRAFEAWLPWYVVDGVLRGTHPNLALDELEPDACALVCETVEPDLIGALASGFSTVELASVVRAVNPPALAADVIRFDARLPQGAPIPVLLRCQPIDRERIRAALAAQPLAREPIPGLSTRIAFRCAYTTISLSDYAAIEVGGGLLLDDTTLGFQKIVAVTAERFAQTCAWQTIKPVLDGPLLKPAGANALGYLASAVVTDKADQTGGGTASIDELPVHLVFELGRTEVAVSDLESLGAGYVFDLNKPLGQSVDILANGRRIGAGELVRIGESIGVRVTRLVR